MLLHLAHKTYNKDGKFVVLTFFSLFIFTGILFVAQVSHMSTKPRNETIPMQPQKEQ